MTCTVVHNATMPTPPQSPRTDDAPTTEEPLYQLEQLMSFYENANTWVHSTRAALFELALAQSAASSPSEEPAKLPPSPAPSSSSPPAAILSMIARTQDTRADAPPAATAETPAETQWSRRKNGLKLELNLDGIGARRRIAKRAVAERRHEENAESQASAPAPDAQMPGENVARMLQLFGDLVDARMESCARMERLVRNANRRDLRAR